MTSDPLVIAAPLRFSGARSFLARVLGWALILNAALICALLLWTIYQVGPVRLAYYAPRRVAEGVIAAWVGLAAILVVLGVDLAFRRSWARGLGLVICVLAFYAALQVNMTRAFSLFGLATDSWLLRGTVALVALAALFLAFIRPPHVAVEAVPRQRAGLISRVFGVLLFEAAIVRLLLWAMAAGPVLSELAWRVLLWPADIWWRVRMELAIHGDLWTAALVQLSFLAPLGLSIATLVAAWGVAGGRRWGRRFAAAVAIVGLVIELGIDAQAFLGVRVEHRLLHNAIAIVYALTLAFCLSPRLRRRVAAPQPSLAAGPEPDAQAIASAIPDDDWRPALLASLRETGVQRAPQNPFVGLILPGVGVVVVIVAWALLGAIVRLAGRAESWPVDVVILTQAVFATIAILVIQPFAGSLVRRLWQFRARSAEAELERAGSRRPILYLRSFALDEAFLRPSAGDVLLGTRRATPEQMLTRVLGKCGPVIAIGQPDEKLPGLGAARFYVSHDLWRQKIADAVKASRLVVWTTGLSEGLRWEIDFLLKALTPGKLIVWAHPQLLNFTPAEREQEWSQFLAGTGRRFPHPLPQALGRARFFRFDADWRPVPVASRWGWFGWLLRPFRTAQTVALKALLRQEGIPPFDPEAVARRRRRLRRIVAGVAGPLVALVVVALGLQFYFEHSRRQSQLDFERSQQQARELESWNELASALISAEVRTDYNANGISRRSVADVASIRVEQRALLDRLDERNPSEESWGNLTWSQLDRLRPFAERYAAIYAAADAEPTAGRALSGVSPAIDLAGAEEAGRRADALARLIGVVEDFAAFWRTIPPENVFTSVIKLTRLTEARLVMLNAEWAILDFLVAHAGGWQPLLMQDGKMLPQFSDAALEQRLSELFAARNAAVEEVSGILNW